MTKNLHILPKNQIRKLGLGCTLLLSIFNGSSLYSQEITIQTRNNASITTSGTNSGFFQASAPQNFPIGASDWWYLIDTRHGDPNYAMQFSGSFHDQNLWFRKIKSGNTTQAWSKVLMEDSDGKIAMGGDPDWEKLTLMAGHENTTFLMHANNGGNPHAYLTLWASEPGSTYNGVGIGNNVRNYINGASFQRINTSLGGSYMRLLENQINFNLVFPTGTNKEMLKITSENLQYNGDIYSIRNTNEGGSLKLVNSLKNTGSQVNEWSIYNMTGVYGNSLQFWAYPANPSSGNGGVRLKLSDEGNMALYGKFEAKEVKVTTSPTADFVFEEHYDLPKLEEVEKYVKENKHLPEIASAKEMEKDGVNIGEFQIKLLQKIEELTLYTIEQNKLLKEQQERIEKLEEQINSKK